MYARLRALFVITLASLALMCSSVQGQAGGDPVIFRKYRIDMITTVEWQPLGFPGTMCITQYFTVDKPAVTCFPVK